MITWEMATLLVLLALILGLSTAIRLIKACAVRHDGRGGPR
jgi:hypothetical protein